MIYTVVWNVSAQDDLAEIWIQAADRQAVNNASRWIDRLLRIDPDTKAAFDGEFYTLVIEPVSVLFEIDHDDCMVRIIQACLKE